MSTVTVPQVNPNDEVTALSVNQGPNAIAAVLNGNVDDANISTLSGTKITSGTLPVAAFSTDANPETRMSETMGNSIASGLIWSLSTGLVGTMSSGVAYVSGKRLVVSAIATKTFTASRDCYISLDATGTVSYQDVTTNANSPTLAAGSIWLAIVVTNGSAITSVNIGQIGAIAPTVSSRIIMISDTNGKLIYPRPGQKLLGYAQITSTAFGSTITPVVGLTIVADVPIGSNVKVRSWTHGLYTAAASTNTLMSIWDGAVGSGTKISEQSGFQNGGQAGAVAERFIAASGVKTYNVGLSNSGSGTTNFEANALYPGFISVELA